jgi:GGDEF domain-containing protein
MREGGDAVIEGFSFDRRRDIYDEETGVYARWYLAQRLEEECSRSRRKGEPLIVVCLGTDVNNAIATGQKLRRYVRDYDLVGRVAEGRFAVAVLGVGPDAARSLGNRLRAIVSDADFGAACFPGDGVCAEELLAHASTLLLDEAAA